MNIGIKKGDRVKVLSGKDRGKEGRVLKALPKSRKIVVEGINVHFRFARPKRRGEKGQRLEIPAALSVSKAILVCPHCARPTRVAHSMNNQKNFRKCKRCGKLIN